MRFVSAVSRKDKIRVYFKVRTNADIRVIKANLDKHPVNFKYVKVHKRVPTHYNLGEAHQSVRHFVSYGEGVCLPVWYDQYQISEEVCPHWYDRTHSFTTMEVL